ncbi:MAG: uncharacterized protein QOI54_844 [Actinomycetota bacterium]|jgi:cephalosporin-C deacetylase-like acetyl esterase|nr:uncharacterized protein [Actinomycetota bacterium]
MTREDVQFDSDGTTVRGWFYAPDGPGPHPTVVLAGGWCYVRELVMPHYAEEFARRGIAALVFDYRNLGVSDGEPRQHLDPWMQITDYQCALSYVETREDVDASRLGAWGISYSGGHVVVLAAIDPRVRAIVSQIPVVDGYENMRRVHGTMGYRALWSRVLEDRAARYHDPAARLHIPHATAEPARDLSTWPFPETFHTFRALKETDAPLYENSSTVQSVDLLLNYDIVPFARRVYDTPVLMIVAEGDDLTLWDLEIGAYNALPTAKKRLHVLPHTTHMTLYSDRAKLAVAADQAGEWFVAHLAPSTPAVTTGADTRQQT